MAAEFRENQKISNTKRSVFAPFFPFQNHWNTVTNHQLQKRFHRPKFLRLCRLLVDYYSVETVQVAYLHIPPVTRSQQIVGWPSRGRNAAPDN